VDGVSFRFIESNGLNMRIAEMGEGPLILLAHGWPESWYSWRHQITALAGAGYHVVAPDMRGYGETDKPADVDEYDIVHLAGDMVGVLDALGEETAIMVGHDWGSVVAWNTVLLHPDRFSAVIAMSVPYSGRSPEPPMASMQASFGDNFFYILYHNEAGGVAEAEYDSNPRGFLSRLYLSPDSPREAPVNTDPLRASGGWIDRMGAPIGMPGWLEPQDLDYIVSQFESAGFRGGVNYYRNLERNWEITENLQGVKVDVPALFIAGEQDGVIGGASKEQLTGSLNQVVDDLRDVVLIPGVGHWVQQEAPGETNAAILEFLNNL
jgi:pimeloyl-ACP methyl ester carboxylesterase